MRTKYLNQIIGILFILILTGCEFVDIKEYNIYILAGQSNANITYSKYLYEQILKYDSNAIMIQINHPGESIINWYNDKLNKNYYDDINYIDSKIKNIKYYKIRTLFWWQGENDSVWPSRVPNYYKRTNELFKALKIKYGNFDVITHLIYNYNPVLEFEDDMIEIRRQQKENVFCDYVFETKHYEHDSGWHLTDKGYKQLSVDVISNYFK